jgi:hypothetical protein
MFENVQKCPEKKCAGIMFEKCSEKMSGEKMSREKMFEELFT